MKKTFIRMALALGVGLGLTGVLQAEDGPHNTLTKAEKDAGWKLLFDGKSVDGWSSWRSKKPLKEGAWKAEEGTLRLTGKGGGDIYTTEAFENYELTLEWKTTGNSGILIRVDPETKGAIWHAAPEMQVDKGNPKAVNSTSAGGFYALYDIQGGEKVFHPNGWNKVRIKMENGKGQHWFNGKLVADYQIGSDDWNARVKKSKFKKYPNFAKKAKGHIGLQDHGHVVSYRNLKIRPL